MKYEYVLNTTTKRLHLRVDGMSDERCNLDQLKDKAVSSVPPQLKGMIRCSRCLPADGSAPIGPAR